MKGKVLSMDEIDALLQDIAEGSKSESREMTIPQWLLWNLKKLKPKKKSKKGETLTQDEIDSLLYVVPIIKVPKLLHPIFYKRIYTILSQDEIDEVVANYDSKTKTFGKTFGPTYELRWAQLMRDLGFEHRIFETKRQRLFKKIFHYKKWKQDEYESKHGWNVIHDLLVYGNAIYESGYSVSHRFKNYNSAIRWAFKQEKIKEFFVKEIPNGRYGWISRNRHFIWENGKLLGEWDLPLIQKGCESEDYRGPLPDPEFENTYGKWDENGIEVKEENGLILPSFKE